MKISVMTTIGFFLLLSASAEASFITKKPIKEYNEWSLICKPSVGYRLQSPNAHDFGKKYRVDVNIDAQTMHISTDSGSYDFPVVEYLKSGTYDIRITAQASIKLWVLLSSQYPSRFDFGTDDSNIRVDSCTIVGAK